MFEAGWNVQHNFVTHQRNATFMLERRELLLAAESTSKSLRETGKQMLPYLSNAADIIDLRAIFTEYRMRARSFHKWFSAELEGKSFVMLRDYERCLEEHKKVGTRMFWRAQPRAPGRGLHTAHRGTPPADTARIRSTRS